MAACSWGRLFAAGISALTLSAVLVGCTPSGNPLVTGEDTGEGSTVTIGSLGTAESEILAQIYGQVLDDAGYEVEYNLSIGSREVFLMALAKGSIDLIPDYAGTLLYGFDTGATGTGATDTGATATEATATTIDEITAALPAVLQPQGLAVLEPAPAEDADALVVTSQFAAANGLVSIADLAPIASTITLGATTGFDARWFGRLEEVYGITGLTFMAIDDNGGAGTLHDLLDGVIQVADIHTTAPSIAANELVVLEDPENLIAAQNVIPLLDADLVSDELVALINAVSAKLTTSGLSDLNALYDGDDKPTAAEVAAEWLTANGFLR